MNFHLAEMSLRSKAKTTGMLYFFSLLTAISGEFVGGGIGFAAGLIAICGMIAVTFFFYEIFPRTSRNLTLLAALFNLLAMACEALRFNPQGRDIALVFHGLFCMLIGYLIFHGSVLPRILGVLLAFAGLVWTTYLSSVLANRLFPYNQVCGILAEASVMLGLLVMGGKHPRLREQASPAGGWR